MTHINLQEGSIRGMFSANSFFCSFDSPFVTGTLVLFLPGLRTVSQYVPVVAIFAECDVFGSGFFATWHHYHTVVIQSFHHEIKYVGRRGGDNIII